MNATAMELSLDLTLDDDSAPEAPSARAWLPLAALAITLIALGAHAPAKLAALAKSRRHSVDLTPTTVNYPLPTPPSAAL